MLNLVLFGPPGSGKGTQAVSLVEKYNLLHISTGDCFRYEIGNKTPLGLEAKSYIDKGELVPDEVTIGMLVNKMKQHADVKGYILDGFPRTVAQAQALDTLFADMGTEVGLLLALNVNDAELKVRLMERGKTSGRADDQNAETIQNRINIYKQETTPVADYYAKTGKTKIIDGIGSIEAIFDRLSSEVDTAIEA
jgi:adenylate kinase